MRSWAGLASVFVVLCLSTLPLKAQEQSWLQVEALPDLQDAQERAGAYATLFPNIQGYQTDGWYAIVLGPMTRDEAGSKLLSLRRENLIPRDSFIADGSAFGAQFWPTGASAAPADPIDPLPEVEPAAEPLAEAEPEESLAQARAAEDALSRDEKKALQEALAWFGFYDGAIDGAYGRGTRGSFSAWQSANGYEPTGVLRTAERAALLNAQAAEQSLFGFDLVNEVESGIEATLPMTLIAFEGYEPPFVQFGPRAEGGPRLMLISEPGDRASLAGLFDLLQSMQTVPAPVAGAEADRTLGEDSFTINATSDTVATYAWARASNGQVKGFLLTWTPDNAKSMARIVQVVQGSFRSVGEKSLDPGLVPLDEAARRGLLTGLTPRTPSFSRSGFYVSTDGAILTLGRDLQSCAKITIDGDLTVSLTAVDPATGAALLTPQRPLSPPAFARFTAASPAPGTEILVAGYAYGAKLPAPVLTFGQLEDAIGLDGQPGLNRLTADVLDGDQGGPVLSATGAVIGLLTGPSLQSGKVLPGGVVFSAEALALSSFLTANGIAPSLHDGAPLSPAAVSDQALGMTLRLDCWPQ